LSAGGGCGDGIVDSGKSVTTVAVIMTLVPLNVSVMFVGMPTYAQALNSVITVILLAVDGPGPPAVPSTVPPVLLLVVSRLNLVDSVVMVVVMGANNVIL
jgi:hypothetical protein